MKKLKDSIKKITPFVKPYKIGHLLGCYFTYNSSCNIYSTCTYEQKD